MKPDWKDAPEWANWLAMDGDGEWNWFDGRPALGKSETVWCEGRFTKHQNCGSAFEPNTRVEPYIERRPSGIETPEEVVTGNEYDSHLICAAKDLYEALDQAITSMQDSGYPNSSVVVRAGKAALAKARGKD